MKPVVVVLFAAEIGHRIGRAPESVVVLVQVASVEEIAGVERRVDGQIADGHLKVARLFDHVGQNGRRVHVVADHVFGGHFLPVEHVEQSWP